MTASISLSLTSKLTPESAETPPKFSQISLTFNLMEMFLSFYIRKEITPSSYKIKSLYVNRKMISKRKDSVMQTANLLVPQLQRLIRGRRSFWRHTFLKGLTDEASLIE
jgi:hypothetical protein